MERKQILSKISTKLAIFETEVRIANANNEYDINQHAETMLIPILDIVFDCRLQNLNYSIHKNFPAIDLGDPEKGLAVQITSTGTTSKAAHSLELFNDHALGKDYSELLFYFIQKPQRTVSLSAQSIVKNLGSLKKDNISCLTNDGLYEQLSTFPVEKLKKVLDILQFEYPDIPRNLPSTMALTPLPSYDHEAGLIGRDQVLKDIKMVLMNSFRVIVINGHGGIGKTSVAAKLCHEIKAENSASIAWITYSGDLKSDLLEIDLYVDLDPAQRPERILEYLKTTPEPLYLFIDNVKSRLARADIELINQFSPAVRIIITSRNRINAFHCISVPALEKDDAVAIYEAYSKRRVQENEMDAFERLLKHTSANTLLIELLAKYASRKFLTLPALIKQLESHGILTMNAADLENVYSEKPMAIKDFLLELYNISDLSPEQKRIMKLLSIFPAERPVTLYVAEWASFNMAELRSLSDWGWIKYINTGTSPYNKEDVRLSDDTTVPPSDAVHPGLPERLYLHSIIKDTVSAQDSETIRFNDYGDFLKKVSGTPNYLGRGTSLSAAQTDIIVPEAIADYRLAHHMNDGATADLCLNLSKAFKRNGDLTNAEKYARKSRNIYQKDCGMNSSRTARALSQYAAVLFDMGDLGRSFRLAQKSLDIRMNLADPSAEASSYDLLGTICIKAGKYGDAHRYLESALSIREEINPEAADTANSLHHLGIVYGRTGRIDDAITCLKKALAIRRVRLAGNHIQTASTLSRLGDIYRSQKDYPTALDYYEQALKIFESLSAVGHPFAESTHFGLGYCYKELGNAAKSAESFGAAYRICLAVYGPDDPHTLEAEQQMR